MTVFFHILSRDDWARAQAAGRYEPPSLAEEGFIHFSTREQVVPTAERYYAGRDDLVLLVVDEGRVQPPVRYEPARGEMFPHVYGPLNLDAVREVVPFVRDGGTFVPPA
jgi:uncharacterized protein (DUF952 family)